MMEKKAYVRQQFDRNIATYNQQAAVQKVICTKLVNQLMECTQGSFDKVLEIGCGTGLLTNEILRHFNIDNYIANDLAPAAKKYVNRALGELPNYSFICGDAENILFPSDLDLVVSASTIQWFDNLIAFFNDVHKALNENGILAFSSFGPNNYCEIRSVLGYGLDYKPKDELEQMLSENFQIISSSEFEQQLHFESPVQVLKHIKQLGANGISRQFWSKGQLTAFEKEYERKFRSNGNGISLTYHPIIIIGIVKK